MAFYLNLKKSRQSENLVIMSLKKSLHTQIHISSTCIYIPEQSAPEKNLYFFAYKIQIKNQGSNPAQLISRKWIITDGLGRTEEVQGPGVVGLQPKILSQQSFSYESACPLPTTSGSMKGHYQFSTDDGEIFDVEIPEFYLIAPQALN